MIEEPHRSAIADALIERGFDALRSGDPAAACAAFLDARSHAPEHPAAWAGLGESLIALERYDQARALLADARTRFPENPWPSLLLARIALRRGERAEAGDLLQAALARGAGEAGLRYAVYRAFEEARDARAGGVLDEAVRCFPDDEALRRAAGQRAQERAAWPEAERHWLAVLRRRPNAIDALHALATARRLHPPAERTTVALYGNCQAEYLVLMLEHVPALSERFAFAPVTNHGARIPADRRTLPASLSHAAIYWEQFDQHPRVDLRERVRARLPSDCRVVRYPSLGMTALWPFAAPDAREGANGSESFPFADRVALELAGEGVPRDVAFDSYLERSRASMPALDRLLERDRRTIERRDAACDVRIGDAVFAHLRTRYDFWAWTYASGALVAELVLRLVQATPEMHDILEPDLDLQLAAIAEMAPGQSSLQVPIHPDVIEHFGLAYVTADSRYRWGAESMGFRAYIEAIVARELELPA